MKIELNHCSNCGRGIIADEDGVIHKDAPWSECNENYFYNGHKPTVVDAKRYTVIMHDGFPESGVPQYPSNANQASTLKEAKCMFGEWLYDSGNDYTRATGYEGPYAEVIPTACWDGISYGDMPFTWVLRQGPRGGIRHEEL